MKKKPIKRIFDYFFGTREILSDLDNIDWFNVLDGVGEGMREVLGKDRVLKKTRGEHRGVKYQIKRINGMSEYYQGCIYGIQLPVYRNLEVNLCVCDDLFWGMIRPLKLSRGETPPCGFETRGGFLIPVLTTRSSMEAMNKSRRVIDCYVDNKEPFEVALSEIDRIYPCTLNERVMFSKDFPGLFTYKQKK